MCLLGKGRESLAARRMNQLRKSSITRGIRRTSHLISFSSARLPLRLSIVLVFGTAKVWFERAQGVGTLGTR